MSERGVIDDLSSAVTRVDTNTLERSLASVSEESEGITRMLVRDSGIALAVDPAAPTWESWWRFSHLHKGMIEATTHSHCVVALTMGARNFKHRTINGVWAMDWEHSPGGASIMSGTR